MLLTGLKNWFPVLYSMILLDAQAPQSLLILQSHTPESLNPAVFCMSHFHSSLFLLSFLSLHSPVTLQPIVLIIRTQTRHHYCYQ